MAVEIQLDPAMIDQVMKEWEVEHPGRNASEMTSEEFADRMMVKMTATARSTDDPIH